VAAQSKVERRGPKQERGTERNGNKAASSGARNPASCGLARGCAFQGTCARRAWVPGEPSPRRGAAAAAGRCSLQTNYRLEGWVLRQDKGGLTGLTKQVEAARTGVALGCDAAAISRRHTAQSPVQCDAGARFHG
jgi:hypothetical protein